MRIVSVRKVSRRRACLRCGKLCYGSHEAVLDNGSAMPLCSRCYLDLEGLLADGQTVELPLKSARSDP